jgi:flagellar protein FlbT
MSLKLSLKPGEKFVLNGAVLVNGDRRATLEIKNKATILRDKDILQADEADTPVKRVYFPIMMLYLEPDGAERHYDSFVSHMTELMGAITNRDALMTCVAISRDVLDGQYYRALMKCRTLFDFEQVRLTYVPAGVPEHTTQL